MVIPALMYHEIGKEIKGSHPYSISEETFENQLLFIKAEQYNPVLLEDYIKSIENDRLKRDRRVVLTFDDTQISNYTMALPLLRKYSYVANFFISTEFINKEKTFLNKRQIFEMAQNGMSIQSHTHTHAFLNGLNEQSVYSELKVSKDILEEIVKKEVTLLSCPGGRFSEVVLEIARDIGYKGICTSFPGMRFTENDVFVFGRYLISADTDLKTFEKIIKMKRAYRLRKQAAYLIKDTVKKVLGNSLYHNFWKLTR